MKLGTAIITIALLASSQAFAADNALKQAINSTFKFQSGERFCSAVAIDLPIPNTPNATILLTAKHCIDSEHSEGGYILQERSDINGSQTTNTHFKVVAVSKEADIAAIIVNDANFKPQKVHIADVAPEEGDQLWSVGYPLGQTRTLTTGYMGQKETVMTPLGQLQTYYHASTLVDVGNSGGPLFGKFEKVVNGKSAVEFDVVGIASVKSGANNFVNGFTSLEDIKKFIAMGTGA